MNGEEAPVFVKVEDYKDVLDVLELIRNKVESAKKTLNEIEELNKQENAELEAWKSTLNELEQKVDNIDKVLFEPESIR